MSNSEKVFYADITIRIPIHNLPVEETIVRAEAILVEAFKHVSATYEIVGARIETDPATGIAGG